MYANILAQVSTILYEDDGHSTKYQADTPEYSTQSFSMKVIDQYV